MRNKAGYLFLVVMAWGGAALADVALEYQDRSGGKKGQSGDLEFLITPKGARINSAEGWLLFDPATRHVFMVKDSDKTYTELDPDQLEALGKQVGVLSEQARAMIQMLPPDQRAQAEKYLTPQKPVAVRYRETGGTRKVNGYPCRDGEMLQADKKIAKLCVATPQAVGLKEGEQKVLDQMFVALSKLQSTASQFAVTPMPNLTQFGGVPVEAVDLQHGRMQQLSKVSTSSLSPDLFVVPASYTRKELSLPKLTQ
ncbi:MAG: hypothetical protein ACRETN_14385 [Nevskiales bacterium]